MKFLTALIASCFVFTSSLSQFAHVKDMESEIAKQRQDFDGLKAAIRIAGIQNCGHTVRESISVTV